ncbi:MAG: S-methyl-5-thioribose-1-phosphate isomerase [Gammaproteobacteria bacterium]|nr:S-methyl-5-thioribose-1-phosphate isomerase [Gammaproteobacteria bacterium]MCP5137004.1 S-methyl-5-thioribose-1-phosphate isomerase [Gammaproteobacteria bacterium]
MTAQFDSVRAIEWRNDRLYLLDQRILPVSETFIELNDARVTADAIRDMVVRGAPAIGVTAAFGIVLAAREAFAKAGADWKRAIEADLQILAGSRPTAVNLFWAIERMRRVMTDLGASNPEARLLAEAQAIHAEDVAANRTMGELGAALIDPSEAVITHCNTGSLATGGYGTALGVIRSAYAAGRIKKVFADETRPWLQGARLTAWELVKDGIPVDLLADGAGAWRMKNGGISWVIVGSDRIAANGDVANKIGTYHAAVAARYHGVKFMVVAPSSTVDMKTATGADIPIETRSADEVLHIGGRRIAAEGAGAWNPVFDVTPAELVDAIVTERGVVLNPTTEKMRAMMA